MLEVQEIVKEAESLPVEDRAIIVDSILRTLNPPEPKIDRKWTELAKNRLEDLRSGHVKPIPGNQVFAKIKERFGA